MSASFMKSIVLAAAALAVSGIVHAIDVVVVGNPQAAALTKDQVADIYSGKSQSATPLDQVESAPIRAEFYKKAIGKDLSQAKAMWARLTFSGKAQPPKEVADAAAVKKAVAADPKVIGYIDKGAVDASVKVVLSFD